MKASQTETVIMLTCCALQSACYSPTGIVISFILAQFQGEVQTNLTVKRFLMCSAALCTYSAERIIYNFAFVALCGALQTHFHRRGRNGKRHLQRRFLRKRGAVGGVLALSGAYAPALPKGEPLAKLHTLQLNRKLFLKPPKAPPFGGAGKTVRF